MKKSYIINACRRKSIILLLLSIWLAPVPLLAGDFDGSIPLLCAVIETDECIPGEQCLYGTAQSIGIPQFLVINFKERTISEPGQDGMLRATKIENIKQVDGTLILQGIQNGKAWSMVINEKTGKFTVTGSDDQVGFVVFGACTTK